VPLATSNRFGFAVALAVGSGEAAPAAAADDVSAGEGASEAGVAVDAPDAGEAADAAWEAVPPPPHPAKSTHDVTANAQIENRIIPSY
jgi:hypothetical protein